MKQLFFIFSVFVLLSYDAFSQIPLSGDVQASTLTVPEASGSYYPRADVSVNPSGHFAQVWYQSSPATPGAYPYKVYTRAFNNAGTPQTASQQVVYNTPPAAYDGDRYPRVSMRSDGYYIVTYMENTSNITTSDNYSRVYFQRFNPSGSPIGGRVFVGYGMWPDVDIAPDGTFAVSYTRGHYYHANNAVYVKRYNAAGFQYGPRITVATGVSSGTGYYNSNVRASNGYKFSACYTVGNGNGSVTIKTYNTGGTNTATKTVMGSIGHRNFVVKPNGDIVAVSILRTSSGGTGTHTTRITRYTPGGASSTSNIPSSSITGPLYVSNWAAIGMNEAGDYIVTYPKYSGTTFLGAYVQQFDINDTPVGPEYPISTAVGDQLKGAAVDVSDCSFVVSWQYDGKVFHKRFRLYSNASVSITGNVYFNNGDPITMTGAYANGSTSSHTWSITESDSYGNTIPGGISWSGSYSGSPGVFTFPSGLNLKCGKYYTIMLTAIDDCSGKAVFDKKVIYIKCPEAAAEMVDPCTYNTMRTKYGNKEIPELCLPNVIVDGSASSGETGYFVELAKFDLVSWSDVGPTYYSGWVPGGGTAPSNINVSSQLGTSVTLVPGEVYRFRLAIGPVWDSVDLFFTVKDCRPEANAVITNSEGVEMMNSKYGPQPVDQVCLPDVIVDGSGSCGEDGYFAELTVFNLATWSDVGSPIYSGWVASGPVPNNLSVSSLLTGATLTTLPAGQVYRFRLAVGPVWDSVDLFFTVNQCDPKAVAEVVDPLRTIEQNSKYGPIDVAVACLPDVIIDGSDSTGENSYYVSLHEFDLMSWTDVGAPIYAGWVPGGTIVPNNLDVSTLLSGAILNPLPAGRVYRFRLAVGPVWDATDVFFIVQHCNTKKDKKESQIVTEIEDTNTLQQDITDSELKMTVFPNPTFGEVNLNFNSIVNGRVLVYSMNHEVIYESVIENTKALSFALSQGKAGVYIIKVITEKEVLTKKLIKN